MPKRNLIISILLVLSISLSLEVSTVPEQISIGTYSDIFSIDSVMLHVKRISQKPHPIGSEEHKRVSQYLIEQIEKQGLVAEVQNTEIINTRSKQLTPVKNVITRLNGKIGRHTMMLVAHYDTQVNTPGAGDDGAGVAVILESIRYFMNRPPMDHNIVFLFTDGEELRSIGAKGFVQEHPWVNEIDFLVNLDTRGSDGVAYAYEMSEQNGELIRAMSDAIQHPVSASFMYEVYKMLPNYSDFTVFQDRGLMGINIAFIEGFHTYHTMLDTPENLNSRSVNHMASYAIPMLEHLDSKPLDNLKSSNRNFFNPVGSWFIHYPSWVDSALFIAFISLFAWMITFGHKRDLLQVKNVLRMALILLGAVVIITGITFFMNKAILAIHPWYDIQSIRGGTLHPKHFVLLFSIINVSVFILAMRKLAYKLNGWEIGLGVILVWGILAIVCQLTISSLSYLVFVPSLPIMLALILFQKLRLNSLFERYGRIMMALIFTLPATFLLTPMIPSIAIALGISQSIGSSIITILLLSIYLISFKLIDSGKNSEGIHHHSHISKAILGGKE